MYQKISSEVFSNVCIILGIILFPILGICATNENDNAATEVNTLVSTKNWKSIYAAIDDIATQKKLSITYDYLTEEQLEKLKETKTTFSAKEKRSWRFVLEQVLAPAETGYFENEDNVVVILPQDKLHEHRRAHAAKRLAQNHNDVLLNITDDRPLQEVVDDIAEKADIEVSYGFFVDGTNVPPAAKALRMKVPMEWRNVLKQVLAPASYDFVEENGFVLPMPEAQAVQRRAAIEMAKPLVTKIFPISYADVDDLISRLQSMPNLLTSRGRLMPSQAATQTTPAGPDAGARLRPRIIPAIVATDVEESIEKIKEFIRSLDTKEEQILIEARVIDVLGSDSKTFGFLWDTLQMAQASAGGGMEWTREVDQNNTLQTEDFRALSSRRQIGMSDTYTRTISDTYGEMRSAILGPLDVSVVLDALKTRDDTELLSHPVVVVGNRSEAEISIETIIDVARIEETDDFDSDRQTTTETVEQIPIGINLWVLPEIAPDKETEGPRHVRMSVRPRMTDLLDRTETPNGTTLLTKSERVVFTRCSVPTGHTLLLGGLTKTEKREQEISVPFFGNIPLLGRLFRHNVNVNEKSNLIILITPTILEKELPSTGLETEMLSRPTTSQLAQPPKEQTSTIQLRTNTSIPIPDLIMMQSDP